MICQPAKKRGVHSVFGQVMGLRECVALAGSDWSSEKGPGQCHALGAYQKV